MDQIVWKLDLDAAEFYADLLEAYNRDRELKKLSRDIGVADDAKFLRHEIEWFKERERDEAY